MGIPTRIKGAVNEGAQRPPRSPRRVTATGAQKAHSLRTLQMLPASSHKATGRQPSKRLKREKSSLVKSDLQEPVSRNEESKGSNGPMINEDIQGNGNHVSIKPSALKASSCPPKTESDETLVQNQDLSVDEESSCKSAESAESELEAADLQKKPLQLDNNAFLDEDSNQPMPVDRFFGNIEFMQDLPAAALPCTAMSRREFRKLHFIAKEDDDDDDVL
uniref:Chromosome 1 open reading frame 174 n=1 Tax=Crocodylus porosus TaxID=8502 RepID=A0A7M4F0I9_CROPO